MRLQMFHHTRMPRVVLLLPYRASIPPRAGACCSMSSGISLWQHVHFSLLLSDKHVVDAVPRSLRTGRLPHTRTHENGRLQSSQQAPDARTRCQLYSSIAAGHRSRYRAAGNGRRCLRIPTVECRPVHHALPPRPLFFLRKL